MIIIENQKLNLSPTATAVISAEGLNLAPEEEEQIPVIDFSSIREQLDKLGIRATYRAIQSDNFVSGSAGWQLTAEGVLEAETGYFRGDISGSTGTFSGGIAIGTSPDWFKVDSSGNIWSGAATLATAKTTNFAVEAVSGLLYAQGATIGGAVIDGTSTIGGRLASVLNTAIDASGHFADDAISTAAGTILGAFTFGASGALQIGTYESGVSGDLKLSPTGILARDSTGATTFSINGTTGVAVLNGLVVGTNVGLGTAQDSSGVTTIVGNTVTTAYVNALDVNAATVSASISITTPTIIGGTIAIGSANNIFKADANGIYLGHATFASAPFSVDMGGALVATSGEIGGWTLGATSLSAVSGGNTTILSSGATALSAGPTGSPTTTITQAGILTAAGVVITGAITTAVGSSIDWTYMANVAIENADIVDATIQSGKIGSLDADKVNVGTLTGFTIQTASSGKRIKMTSSLQNRIQFLDGAVEKGYLKIDDDGDGGYYLSLGGAGGLLEIGSTLGASTLNYASMPWFSGSGKASAGQVTMEGSPNHETLVGLSWSGGGVASFRFDLGSSMAKLKIPVGTNLY